MDLQTEYKNRTDGNGHFFDADTMRFFGSRIGAVRIIGDDWYFITSEKPPHGRRMYSVRKMELDGNIETIGEFCSMTSYRATQALRTLQAI